jgi:hypothetical protein
MLEVFRDSPNGYRTAVLCEDERGATLYFAECPSGRILSTVWVRNFGQVAEPWPDSDGQSLMLPSEFCAHPEGAPPFKEEDLDFIFFEAGDGVALYENGELLAVLPPWARIAGGGLDPIPGYARDCRARYDPLAWPLAPALGSLDPRLKSARAFWQEWTGEHGSDRFFELRDERMAVLESELGPHREYFVMEPKRWPIRIGCSYPRRDSTPCLTLGLATQPMPGVEGLFEEPALHRRIELGIVLPAGATRDQVSEAGDALTSQCTIPWLRNTHLAELHTIQQEFYPGLADLPFAILVRKMEGIPKLSPWNFRGDPVTPLWLVRITKREQDLAVEKGGEVLLDLFRQKGVSAIWEPRACTVGKRFFGLF